jgi:hypothetical protein
MRGWDQLPNSGLTKDDVVFQDGPVWEDHPHQPVKMHFVIAQ